jgi:hypothetical protein
MARRKSRKVTSDVFPSPPAWARPGFPMLIEAEADLATLLWQAVADVRLWSAERPETRAGLFAPISVRMRRQVAEAVQEYPVLRWSLRTLEAMISAPADTRAADVAMACSKIQEWADAHHMVETSVQFAEAAAVAYDQHHIWGKRPRERSCRDRNLYIRGVLGFVAFRSPLLKNDGPTRG